MLRLFLSAGLVCCVVAGQVRAQAPSLAVPLPPATYPAVPVQAPTYAPAPVLVEGPASTPPWELDAIFGLPTGLRLSRALSDRLDAEVIAGAYLLDPAVGAGLRWRCIPYQGMCDALVIRPGVDGYLLVNPDAFRDHWWHHRQPVIGLVGADVDAAWQHRLDSNCVLEIGAKLGTGVAFTHHPGLVPLAGVFIGLRY